MSEHETPTHLRRDGPLAMKSIIYMNSMTWLADFVHVIAENTDFTVDEIEAQVQKDLKYLLDQNSRPN